MAFSDKRWGLDRESKRDPDYNPGALVAAVLGATDLSFVRSVLDFEDFSQFRRVDTARPKR